MSHEHTPMESGWYCATCGVALEKDAIPEWKPAILSAREVRERNERTLKRYIDLHPIGER